MHADKSPSPRRKPGSRRVNRSLDPGLRRDDVFRDFPILSNYSIFTSARLRHFRASSSAVAFQPSLSSTFLMSSAETLIFTFARSVCSCRKLRESRAPHPRAIASAISAWARLFNRIGTPSSRASSVASVTSLCASFEREIGRLELALQELVAHALESALAAQRALADRRPQRERLHPGLDAHREDFGQRGLNRVARGVVDQLRDRAGADRPDVAHLVADRVEHLPCTCRRPPCRRPPSSASLPDFAPFGPPLTGASRNGMPFSANFACRRRTTVGELVERSNHAVPALIPS